MISNLEVNQEHMDVIEAELSRVGQPLPMSYLSRRFELDADEVMAAMFELEEQGRVSLTVSGTAGRTVIVTLNERTEKR